MAKEVQKDISVPSMSPFEHEEKMSLEAQQNYRPTSRFERTIKDAARDVLPTVELITGIDVTNQCRLGNPGTAELVRDAANAYKQMPSLMKKSGALIDDEDGLNRGHLRTLEQMPLTLAEQAAVKFLKHNFDELETGRLIDTGGFLGFFSKPYSLRGLIKHNFDELETGRSIDTGGLLGFFSKSYTLSRITMKSLQRNFEGARPTGGPIKPAEDDKGSRVDMQIHLRKAKS